MSEAAGSVGGAGGTMALPEETGLPAERERGFRRERAAIGRHHQAWRRGMPGLDSLFDDDAHRARALAGNLATEFGDVLAAWRRAAGGEPPEGYVAAFRRAWRRVSLEKCAEQAWPPEADATFARVLDELMLRALVAPADGHGARPGSRARVPARWRAAALRLTRPLRRFFRPRG